MASHRAIGSGGTSHATPNCDTRDRVPAEACLEALRDCAAKGVRAVIVMSAGFAEACLDE